MRNRRVLFTLPFVALCLTLAGCEPSNSDIKHALENAQAQAFGGDVSRFYAATGIAEMEYQKVGCTADGAGYRCDVKVTAHTAAGKKVEQVSAGRFVKTDAGWVAMN